MKKIILTSLCFAFCSLSVNSAMAAKVENYKCKDVDGIVKVSFPDNDHAIMITKNDVVLMKSVEAANGARYVGEGSQLWSHKDNKFNLATITSEEESKGSIAKDSGVECIKIK